MLTKPKIFNVGIALDSAGSVALITGIVANSQGMRLMMLNSNNSKSMTTAIALRAIGQNLSELFPLNLEIELRDGAFHITGKSLGHIMKQGENNSERIMQRAWDFWRGAKRNWICCNGNLTPPPFPISIL